MALPFPHGPPQLAQAVFSAAQEYPLRPVPRGPPGLLAPFGVAPHFDMPATRRGGTVAWFPAQRTVPGRHGWCRRHSAGQGTPVIQLVEHVRVPGPWAAPLAAAGGHAEDQLIMLWTRDPAEGLIEYWALACDL